MQKIPLLAPTENSGHVNEFRYGASQNCSRTGFHRTEFPPWRGGPSHVGSKKIPAVRKGLCAHCR